MDTWKTYRLEDFIPFEPEIYWRLLERINEMFWPMHFLTVAFGLATVFLALRGNTRIALVLLAPAWLSSGTIFHLSYYAELNWAAPWFGRAFVAEAALLLASAALTSRNRTSEKTSTAIARIGAMIAVGAVLGYPLIAATLGQGPTHAEIYGLHPDPTAIATLGVLLIAQWGATTWVILAVPLLWCLIATLTLSPLGAAWAWLPLASSVSVVFLAAIASLGRRLRAANNRRRA